MEERASIESCMAAAAQEIKEEGGEGEGEGRGEERERKRRRRSRSMARRSRKSESLEPTFVAAFTRPKLDQEKTHSNKEQKKTRATR